MKNIPHSILIEASTLSLDDEFMKYKPRDEAGKKLKALLTKAITQGVKDFYMMNINPSFTENKEGIQYVKGKYPAMGNSFNWWKNIAKELYPERNSRLGTISQYAAFLGVFMKKIMANGCSARKAWQLVTIDSSHIEYYWKEPRNSCDDYCKDIEYTGSHLVLGFYDLTTFPVKYVAEDDDDDYGGFYRAPDSLNFDKLGAFTHAGNWLLDDKYGMVGWIVFDPE